MAAIWQMTSLNGPIDSTQYLAHVMALRRIDDGQLPEAVMTKFISVTHIHVTRSQSINYHQVFSIRRTKYQNLNVSCFVLQLSLRSLLKPGVRSRMKM